MGIDLGHLLGEARPRTREADARVFNSKIDLRKVAVMWSRGMMPSEIVDTLDMSPVILEELMRSEEFSLEVNALLATREITSLDKALESTAVEALIALRDVMKNSLNEAVKVKAAMYLIDQHRGKAPQHIQLTSGKVVEDPKQEAERLKKKLGYT